MATAPPPILLAYLAANPLFQQTAEAKTSLPPLSTTEELTNLINSLRTVCTSHNHPSQLSTASLARNLSESNLESRTSSPDSLIAETSETKTNDEFKEVEFKSIAKNEFKKAESATLPPPPSFHRATTLPNPQQEERSQEEKEALPGLIAGPRGIRVIPLTATVSAFRTLLTLTGATIIHYGGHGDSNGSLMFEGIDGIAAPLPPRNLTNLFQAGRSQNTPQTTQLVVLSACHSIHAANAFVAAGIPHVVCTIDLVRDESTIEFENQFYQALFTGRSVQEAFDIARKSLVAASTEGNDDPELFQLLGTGDHRDKLFSNHPASRLISFEVDPQPTTYHTNLPAGVDVNRFIGRNTDIYATLHLFSKRERFIAITGDKGIGKTALCVRAVRYSSERKSHFDKVTYIECRDIEVMLRKWESTNSKPCSLARLCKHVDSQLMQDMMDMDSSLGASADRESFLGKEVRHRQSTTDSATPAPFSCTSFFDALSSSSDRGGGRVLTVLDGLDKLLDSKHRDITSQFMNELLKNPQMTILATSRVPLPTLLKAHQRPPLSGNDSSSSILPPTQHLNDVTCCNQALPPLDPYSTALMLIKTMHRKLRLDEMASSSIKHENQDEMDYHRWIDMLSNRPAVLRTQGLPGEVRELAQELEGKFMDECDEAPTAHRPMSERNMKELLEGEIEKLGITDQRCIKLWSECVFYTNRLNNTKLGGATGSNIMANLQVIVSWETFQIQLQLCIDKWTRGSGEKGKERQLKRSEVEFLNKRMSSKPIKNGIVTFELFKKFCKWWAPTLATLITLSSEWQREEPLILHGFISRAEAEGLLSECKEGYFLVRFSESRAGWLALSFNEKKRNAIRRDHCLVSLDREGFTLFFGMDLKRTYETLGELVQKCRKLVKLVGSGSGKTETFGAVVPCYAPVWDNNNSSNGKSWG